MPEESFDFSRIAQKHEQELTVRRRRPKWVTVAIVGGALVAVAAMGYVAHLGFRDGRHPPTAKSKTKSKRPRTAKKPEASVATEAPVEPSAKTPEVASADDVTVDDIVHVESAAHRLSRLVDALRERGELVEVLDKEFQTPYAPLFGGEARVLLVGGGQLHAFQYETEDEAEGKATEISPDAATLFGKPRAWNTPAWFFRQGTLLVLYTGNNGGLRKALTEQLGEPFAAKAEAEGRKLAGLAKEANSSQPGEQPPATAASSTTAPAKAVDSPVAGTSASGAEEELLALYRDKKLLVKKEYPTLRKIFADDFQERFQAEIRTAFGDDFDAMNEWLDAHGEIKEELYTAIRPETDDVAAALALFKRLKDEFPDKIGSYGELAIAVAVTWDKEEGAIYDYRGHAARAKSPLPDGPLDAVGNFRFMLEAEANMQGRAQLLPWEFLTHVVNHRTPADERKWALTNYLSRRAMFGKCYSDVPYDHLMLKTQSQQGKLNGSPYTLANILGYGGVCAHQADFSSRVGKSLGVPAEYVSGQSAFGDLHAWVVWVEIKSVGKNGIGFSVESHGRYRGDNYYVGNLRDPQTGLPTTDRELELRLHMVGVNPLAKRQADLAMRAFPALRQEARLDTGAQLRYLCQVTGLCPWNEAAWLALGELAREELPKQYAKLMASALERLFTTFAAFPDFTWKAFDDLIAFQKKPKQRNALYERLVGLYEQAGRPDLACEARLKLSDYLVEDEKYKDAIEGLATSIKRFPDEGRYVPRLLDKLETVCGNVERADEQLLSFYQEFLPLVPPKRGDDPSTYCMAMYERAISRFKAAGQAAAAQTWELRLAQIKSGHAPAN